MLYATIAFRWVNLGVTCCSAELLLFQATRQHTATPPARLGGKQPSDPLLELSKASQQQRGDGNGCILPVAGDQRVYAGGIAASAHSCPSCLPPAPLQWVWGHTHVGHLLPAPQRVPMHQPRADAADAAALVPALEPSPGTCWGLSELR